MYKLLLADDYNSESLTLIKGNPEHLDKKFFVFVFFLEVSRTAVVCGYISVKILNLLTLVFQKKFVCIIFVGSKNNGLRFLSNMESSYV